MPIVVDNFIDPEIIEPIVKNLEFEPIISGRRVAHFGYKYDYFRKTLTKCDPIPGELNFNDRLGINFNQLIINEYKKSQGISAHIDDPNLFGPTIACISVGAAGTIRFGDKTSIKAKIGSLYILEGDYRYKHTHQYRNNSNATRYSLTYRTVV